MLAVRFDECPGLDLTRATLAACLKYPWLRDLDNESRRKKWGAYKTDEDDFEFARAAFDHTAKTAEAEIMDWADDIAYSVHDLEDFHRCGAVPWHRILSGDQAEQIIGRAKKAWFGAPPEADGRLREALRGLETFLKAFRHVINEPYEGTREQRWQLRDVTSRLIGRYITALQLNVRDGSTNQTTSVMIADEEADEVRILKQITRDYIINNPSLAAQQKGHENILRTLFDTLAAESRSAYPKFLPIRLRYLWTNKITTARFVADCIASLTETEAVGLYNRLQGLSSGSVLDPIVR
jgi:dGTPase